MWTWLNWMAARIRALFRAGDDDRDLGLEYESHLSMLTEDKIRSGMTAEEARREARLELGGLAQLQQAHRDIRLFPFVDTLWQDARYGLRMLRRNPGFTTVAVLTLALGIGANTAIFSVVNAVLLRSLPYRDSDRLVMVRHYGTHGVSDYVSGRNFLAWRDQAKTFEQVAAYRTDTVDLTGRGEPERLSAGLVSANLFRMLGTAPAHGRAFTLEEDTAGGAPVVILSDGLWRRRFGGDPQVIGQTLILGDQSRTVVGIMPHGFRSPREYDLWLPLALKPTELRKVTEELTFGGGLPDVSVIARLKPGVTPEAASADLSVILERLQMISGISSDDPPDNKQVRVIKLSDWLVGNVRLSLLVLFGAVTFVLLIACANVANLLLARSAARKKELAIRAAMGAGRLRLVRQLLTESLLLSLAGGGAGLLVASWGVKLLVAMSPAGIARIEESGVDGRVVGFTCIVVVLVGLITGIFPALQASKTDVIETLKLQSTARGAQSGHGKGQRALPALVIVELALVLVLLVGAGLMIKSFLRLLAVPKGFNPDGVLTLELSRVSRTKYPMGSPQRRAYFQEILTRVQALPGIQSAGLTGFLPLTGSNLGLRIIEGPKPSERDDPYVDANHITLDYFRTMGIEMHAGRPFATQDGAKSQQVAIINETLARRLFQKENPIGQQLMIAAEPAPRIIVGVVGDTRHFGLDREVNPEVYLPYMQPFLQSPIYVTYLNLAVRVASGQNNPTSLSVLAANIRNLVSAIDQNEPVSQIVTMDERLAISVAERRFQMFLLGVFAAVALIIAVVGIYGVISYAISRRTHEIGVRLALGAQAGDVLRMVLWRGMSLTLIGVTLGLAAAFAFTRVLKNLLFEVKTTDPTTFALIALMLIGVALIASYIPARRATKVDPLQALRHE
jgi:putative ABC transport system permease protein